MFLISKVTVKDIHSSYLVKPDTQSRCEKESPCDQKPGTRCLDHEESFTPPITFEIDYV